MQAEPWKLQVSNGVYFSLSFKKAFVTHFPLFPLLFTDFLHREMWSSTVLKSPCFSKSWRNFAAYPKHIENFNVFLNWSNHEEWDTSLWHQRPCRQEASLLRVVELQDRIRCNRLLPHLGVTVPPDPCWANGPGGSAIGSFVNKISYKYHWYELLPRLLW